MEREAKRCCHCPQKNEEMLDSPALCTRGNSVCNRIKEVVYLGFDFPSELEVKKKKEPDVLSTFRREIDSGV
ncbi:hypothetical protein CEXT_410211 [Caerostris extrusa]|uniref:Uncharacterized protein n=1 Tax=Caerostris extrusa TaxID=172846 RepID=A0AAV4TKV1_CAEEX|nr:hypothetical protein CEXT_410211 [Caerostris extrusa]